MDYSYILDAILSEMSGFWKAFCFRRQNVIFVKTLNSPAIWISDTKKFGFPDFVSSIWIPAVFYISIFRPRQLEKSGLMRFSYFLPFLLAIVAEQAGQYHLPFGGAVIPTHG